MKSIGAEKVQKPNWDNMTKQEAQNMLLEVNEKIATLEERFGMMNYRDYDEISKRLFEEKRKCLCKLTNHPLPKREAEILTKKKINQHKGKTEEECQKLLEKMNGYNTKIAA